MEKFKVHFNTCLWLLQEIQPAPPSSAQLLMHELKTKDSETRKN